MLLTGLEQVLVSGFVMTVGAFIGSAYMRSRDSNKCDKCGITHLRRDIKVQFFMIRHLAQKQGTTPAELLEIEAKANQAMREND